MVAFSIPLGNLRYISADYILIREGDLMKNILFTHTYFLRLDPKQWNTGLPYPPLGTLYAAALMRQNGYRVTFFDTMFSKTPGEVIEQLNKEQPDYFVLYDDGFNYLSKMCLTNMREAALSMIAMAKKNKCRIIISGSDSTDHFEKYLNAGADFVLIGEGELTLLELVNAINSGNKDLSCIQGLVYRKNNEIIRTASRSLIKDLDQLPIPAWDLLNIEPYRQSWVRHAGYFSINMATTRGCPFKCNWCAKPIYGNRYNSRSPGNVVQEIKLLNEKFSIDHIWFCDDIFGLKPGWVQDFADILEKENLKLNFKIQCRADLLLEENYINDLARAGCTNIWIGAESGSQKILNSMDKGITVEQVYRATRLLKKHRIHPSFFIQFGYPGETREDIEMTIQMINDLLPHDIGISVSYPLPGTGFYNKVKDQLKAKSNWTDSDELQLMFKNTYSPSFYKQLHRYVHKNYRKHLAVKHLNYLISNTSASKLKNLKKAASILYYLPATFISRQKLNLLEMQSS